MLARSFYLSLRMDGVTPTVRRVGTKLYGIDARYIFVRFLEPPVRPVELPVEHRGIVVRPFEPRDRYDLRVQRYEPPEAHGPCDTIVATRKGRIVGAAWYADTVNAEQPWFAAVQPHLLAPARFTANIFSVKGEKGVAYTLAKTGSDWMATRGVRTIVGMVGASNKPSILMTRLMGGAVVAQLTNRWVLGTKRTTVEIVEQDADTGLRGHS